MFRRLLLGVSLFWGGVNGIRADDEPAWLQPSMGPLSPSVHFDGAVGSSSGDPEELAVGHHDPTREDGTVQGIEATLSLRMEKLQGFANYHLGYGAEEEWERSWEEAFLKLVDLPGGFEVRGGRMLGRFGQQNAIHLHSWDFVDTPLVLGRFLGEDGLGYDGGEVTWLSRGIEATYGVVLGFGESKSHPHHEHEEEGEEEAEEEHGGEEIAFADEVGSARFFTQRQLTDYRSYESGLSLAMGDEEEGREVAVAGIDFTYGWRENGLEPGGRAYTWTTELLYRDVDSGGEAGHGEEAVEAEPEDHGALPGGSEYGFYSSFVYTANHALDLGARVGYVEGNDELETEERFQVSPAITLYPDAYRRVSIRTQYNYDDLEDGSEEHSAWVQLGLSWGGAEVR